MFFSDNPSGRTVDWGSTHSVTEMSTSGIFCGKEVGVKQPVRRADNLATFICRFSRNSGSLKLLEPSGPVQACNGIALVFVISLAA